MDTQVLAVNRKLAQFEHIVEVAVDEHAAVEAALRVFHYVGLHRAAVDHVVETQLADVPARRFEGRLVFATISFGKQLRLSLLELARWYLKKNEHTCREGLCELVDGVDVPILEADELQGERRRFFFCHRVRQQRLLLRLLGRARHSLIEIKLLYRG